ncbi:MAG TPA: hypothetical protein VIA18_01180 [Polyangia bacterium]|nr:hypothetical protein [Polyangia bacterium]HWE28398.1 hypothetical protein [Polyangia bacterium]
MNGGGAIVAAAVSVLLFMALNTITGIRLLGLARRTHELPELYLGLAHLLAGALGWAMLLFASLVEHYGSHPVATLLMICGIGCLNVGHAAIALFAWRVFSPRTRWLVVPFALLVLTLLVDFVHNGLMTHLFAPPTDTFWFWPGMVSRTFAWMWLMAVTLPSSRKLQRQVPLGLVDAQTANRMFLMFLASAFLVLLCFVVNTASLLGTWTTHPLTMATVSELLAVPSAICSLLAFVPPRAYTDWIARRAPVVAE